MAPMTAEGLGTEQRQDGFAAYLAKTLIAKKGYRPGTVPEAHALFEHCDAVLTRADGLTFSIVAIVDRKSDLPERFALTRGALQRIGTACLRYAGRAGFRKLPVSIAIIEVGRAPPAKDGAEPLEPLKSGTLFSKVLISAFAVDTAAGDVWTNAPLRGRIMRYFLKGLMRKSRVRDEALMPKLPAAMAARRPLILTYSLIAALFAVFIAEFLFRVSPASGMFDPSIRTLVALGALDKGLVLENGQWWRLFTAPLLHGGLIHIGFNCLALFFAGAVLENVIGRAWFAAIFAVSGLTGAGLSLFANPENLISVGASGAIMGLFAAAFAVSYRYPTASPMRTFLQSGSLRVLIPSVLPLFDGLFGQRVDIAAHIGGAIGGVSIGAALLTLWRREEAVPPFRTLAWVLAAAILCGSFYGGVQAAKGYDEYSLASTLIPAPEVPKDFAAGKENAANLVASYPGDPRSHMYRALALSDAGDNAGAEREWSAALAEEKTLRMFFNPGLEQFIRANLAASLKENGKEAEAHGMAQPICAGKSDFRDALVKEGLCR